jgi:hypothetical protein
MACLAMAALGGAPIQAEAALTSIWAVDDGEKVFQDDLAHPLKAGGGDNSVWDGTTVRLFAARNEIVAFQLILEADADGASAVNVSVSDLTSGDTSIRGSHPLLPPNDYLGLGVELFTQHYFDISTPSWDSDCGGLGWSGDAKPGITGWIPDALVPFAAAQGKGGAPFDIGASLNQGVWVDTYIPRTAPAGLYTGTISVSVQDVSAAEIPLELEVLNFTLPDETHYKTMVFYSKDTLVERHTTGWCTPEMWEMMRAYNRMAHRHRLELIGCGNFDEANNLTGTLTGEAFTAAGNYDGPGVGVGNSLFSVATYGGWWSQDQSYYETQSDAWVNWFNDNGLGDLEYFLYLTDEPSPALYPLVQERAAWIHDNPGPGQNLPVFLTRWPIADLVGAIDIWCTPPQFYDLADAVAAQARGERVWLYASYRPNTPADATDEYGIAWRLKAWVAHARDIPRWFTWESTHYYNNSNEVDPGGRKNVWANPIGFSREWYDGIPCPMDTGNGDGILFYPGQDAVFPEEDREYPGPVSSIRMKMYRRGIQDVEYMWLAEQLGFGSDVGAMLDDLLPHVMWDALTVPDWSNSNAVYEQARRQLADLIEVGPITDDTIGLLNPAVSRFYLRNSNTSGVADITFSFGPGGSGWTPVIGDWDGDGVDTIGLFDPARSRFYLRNSNTTGVADVTVNFGPGGSGWTPLAGDWDGDGTDTTGLCDPVRSRFYLRNSNTTGVADIAVSFGPGGSGWTPLAGDWDGDGTDTIGLFDPAKSRFYLRNSNTTGVADITVSFGPGGSGWTPLAGDWDGDATDTIGLFDPARSRFYLRNSNTTGVADIAVSFGPASSGWTPITGDWDGL